MSRIDGEVFGKREQPLAYGMKQLPGIPLLEIGAARAADQQRVTGEDHSRLVQHEAEAAHGVTRGGAHLDPELANLEHVTVVQTAIAALRTARSGAGDLAAQGLFHQPSTGHVIGVDVRLQSQ